MSEQTPAIEAQLAKEQRPATELRTVGDALVRQSYTELKGRLQKMGDSSVQDAYLSDHPEESALRSVGFFFDLEDKVDNPYEFVSKDRPNGLDITKGNPLKIKTEGQFVQINSILGKQDGKLLCVLANGNQTVRVPIEEVIRSQMVSEQSSLTSLYAADSDMHALINSYFNLVNNNPLNANVDTDLLLRVAKKTGVPPTADDFRALAESSPQKDQILSLLEGKNLVLSSDAQEIFNKGGITSEQLSNKVTEVKAVITSRQEAGILDKDMKVKVKAGDKVTVDGKEVIVTEEQISKWAAEADILRYEAEFYEKTASQGLGALAAEYISQAERGAIPKELAIKINESLRNNDMDSMISVIFDHYEKLINDEAKKSKLTKDHRDKMIERLKSVGRLGGLGGAATILLIVLAIMQSMQSESSGR